MKIIIFASLFLITSIVNSQITVDTTFEGANARVLSIDNSTNTITVESKLKSGDTRNVVLYFKADGYNLSAPLKIRINYSQQYYLPNLAAYSFDGISWHRYPGVISGGVKLYTRLFTQSPVYFSYGFPYVYSDLVDLSDRLKNNEFVTVSDLTVSNGGRPVKLFKITEDCVPDKDKYLIWILGRQHAFETHSNYVVEGLIDFLASNNSAADKLRRKAIIYIVPVMDVDKAATGGTGKDQLPVDINRDWDSPSYWNAVIAVKQKLAETTSKNQLKIFLDSHDPFPADDDLFFYSLYNSGPKSYNLDFFRKLLYENAGYVFNRQPSYLTNGQTSSRFVDSLYPETELPITIETGWSYRSDNAEWTIPLYKKNGENLGKGMSEYIGNILRPGDIILDNTDTSGVTITGNWSGSNFTPGYWGANYIHDGNMNKGQKSILYNPVIPEEGDYEVFIRWTQETNRAVNVPVKIIYNGGTADTSINEQTKGAEWVTMGIYNFAAGNSGSVLIETTGTTDYVIADAVRFSKINYCNPVSVAQISSELPSDFTLYQNYPNPFNPVTKIKFDISPNAYNRDPNVVLSIYNLLGEKVATLINEYLSPGTYEVTWDAGDFPSGIYYFRLETGFKNLTKKMILVK